MVAGFQLRYERAINHHIYCIHYITKIFLMQGIVRVYKSLVKVVAGPHPNSSVWQRFFDSLAQVDNSSDVLVCQRFSTKNREVAMDSIFL